MTTKTKNTKKVWEALNKAVSGILIQELCMQLTMTFEEVMTAVRWIARDYNIGLDDHDGNLMLVGVQND